MGNTSSQSRCDSGVFVSAEAPPIGTVPAPPQPGRETANIKVPRKLKAGQKFDVSLSLVPLASLTCTAPHPARTLPDSPPQQCKRDL